MQETLYCISEYIAIIGITLSKWVKQMTHDLKVEFSHLPIAFAGIERERGSFKILTSVFDFISVNC